MECAEDDEFYEEEYGVSPEKMNKAIKEMTGLEVKEQFEIASTFYEYNKNTNRYSHFNGDGQIVAKCLNITDISYEDGIYTVDYQYFYPGDDFLTRIKNKDAFESTLQFKINENYEYIKYQIVSDIYNLKSKKIVNTEENETNKDVITNEDEIDYLAIKDAALEYRMAEKITNYKDFNYDLDGDGKLDKITIRKNKSNEYDDEYLFELNGRKFATTPFHLVSLRKYNIYELAENEKFKIKNFIDEATAIIEYNGSEQYLIAGQGYFWD